jgi:hypothetical protein
MQDLKNSGFVMNSGNCLPSGRGNGPAARMVKKALLGFPGEKFVE